MASYGSGSDGRIDIFDGEGHFITEFTDPHGPQSVAVDSKGNLYVFEQVPGEDSEIVRYPPKKYEPEAGNIEYSQSTRVIITTNERFRNGLAIDFNVPTNLEDDQLLVAQGIQISEYSSASSGNTLLGTIEPLGLSQATYVAVDSVRRRLYIDTCKGPTQCGVLVLSADAPYSQLKEIYGPGGSQFFSTQGWLSLAVDEDSGHFFIGDTSATENIYEFDETFERVSTFQINAAVGANLQMAVANNPLGLDPEPANRGYLFVPIPIVSGSALAYALTQGPPDVKDLQATNITEEEAQIGAVVDPNGLETKYAIEYVSDAQFAIDEFASATVAGSGTIAGTSQPHQVIASLSDREAGQTYHFRVTAENEAASDEEKSFFATYKDASSSIGLCPNEALRMGAAKGLPDCRAYELVTPPDTNGGAPLGAGVQGDRFGMVQASPQGSAVSFELQTGSVPGVEATGGFHGDPFHAFRSLSGWSTSLAGPTGTESSKPQPGSFSPDQGYDFWLADGTGSAIINGKQTHYIRYPDGHSELVGRGSLGTEPLALGRLITEDGAHIVFQTGNSVGAQVVKLEPNAPGTGIGAVYDRTADEVTHVVSLLPGDVTPTTSSTYKGASPEGEGIAFENEGKLYLRLRNATTYEIGAGATYAGLSEGGERIFYLRGGDLHAFDVSTEEEIDFSDTGDAVPVNVAPSGTRAYFVSEEEVPGSGPNPEGEEAQTGAQNLYLSEEGDVSFVAIVTDRDVQGEVIIGIGVHLDGLGNWTEALEKGQPATDPSRLDPSGSVFLFQSRADLTGYDPGSDPQIYRYDADADRLHCLSCPPTKTPSAGGALLQSIASNDSQAPIGPFGFVPNLTPDGSRAVFESTEALVSGDTDGLRDVYEWEEEGTGSCQVPGGCVYLLSSAQSARDDYLFGQSQNGDDVFFTTADVLVPGDEETISIYDARVGGGFAQQPSKTCPLFERCVNHTSDPSFSTPPSESVGPPGNVNPTQPKKCPKGKHKAKRKGKVVCVKKKKHHKGQPANTRRGAAK